MSEGVPPKFDIEQAASKFGVLAEIFRDLSNPAVLTEVLDRIAKSNDGGLRKLLDRYEPWSPKAETFCVFVRDTLQLTVPEQRCALRLDLTPQERMEAADIHSKHFPRRPMRAVPAYLSRDLTGKAFEVILEVIPPGAYLEELRAAGLITCWEEDVPVEIPGPVLWEECLPY